MAQNIPTRHTFLAVSIYKVTLLLTLTLNTCVTLHLKYLFTPQEPHPRTVTSHRPQNLIHLPLISSWRSLSALALFFRIFFPLIQSPLCRPLYLVGLSLVPLTSPWFSSGGQYFYSCLIQSYPTQADNTLCLYHYSGGLHGQHCKLPAFMASISHKRTLDSSLSAPMTTRPHATAFP